MDSTKLALEQRIARLEAIEEIKRLKAKYAHFFGQRP